MEIRDHVLAIKNGRNFDPLRNYFREYPEKLPLLIDLINDSEKYPFASYASWALTHLCKTQAVDIQPHYKKIIDTLFAIEDQSARRNLLCTIDHLTLTSYKEGKLLDKLVGFIENHENKVAVHVYSMRLLAKLVKKYPELKPEISELLQLYTENKTPAYASGMKNFFRMTKNIV